MVRVVEVKGAIGVIDVPHTRTWVVDGKVGATDLVPQHINQGDAKDQLLHNLAHVCAVALFVVHMNRGLELRYFCD